jgi:hypothetical protein
MNLNKSRKYYLQKEINIMQKLYSIITNIVLKKSTVVHFESIQKEKEQSV